MHALAPSAPSDLAALCAALGMPAITPGASPERVLERLLDLPRSVELGAVLDLREGHTKLVPDPDACEAERARLGLFEERLVRRLLELRADLDRAWAASGAAGRARPDAAELRALVEAHLTADTRSSDASFAARLAQRCLARPCAALASVLKELNWLRQDLRAALRQGSAHSLGLAALDATLDGALRAELERCRSRLDRELTGSLESGIARALGEIDRGASTSSARWLDRDGCIGQVVSHGRRLANALLDLEWAALMGLLQAASEPLRTRPLGARGEEARSLPPPHEDIQR